ncbi:hypothetical protein C9374_003170 [Naegleria lovaniensis]|uniref:Uncharacterized protein n=1 Tax=Naegleria lovaniensis TaxID=51637 RepID=A0AA88KM36_NAELO|nr:uncharacterized protein C9374_003170 [Naegleria lovaniensis]KAG2386021.1 hypothetical protein C9374_003170 [Naegleria lovaniensis]
MFEYDLTSPADTDLDLTFETPSAPQNSSQPTFSPYQFVATTLDKSSYNYYPTPYSQYSLTLLAVFKVNFYANSATPNNITLGSIFTYPRGILNTYGNTVVQYIFDGSRFVQPQETFTTRAGVVFYQYNLTQGQQVIFGVFGYQFTPRLYSAISVPGPSQYQFTLDSTRQQYLTITFPYQPKTQNNIPSFSLGSNIPSSYNLPSGYIALTSFQYSTSVNGPDTTSQQWIFAFNSLYGFTDVNGKSVSIRTSTLNCACASSSYSSFNTIYAADLSNNQLVCSNYGLACNYFAVIAKPTVLPSPSPSSPSPSSITRLTLGSSISSNIYSSSESKYYKVSLYSDTTVTISIYASSGYGSIYISKDSVPTSTNYDQLRSVSSYTTTLYVTSYSSYSREIYIMVTPSSSYMSFTISASSQSIYYSSTYPQMITGIVFASIFGLFSLIAIIVVIITINKNKNRPYVNV